MAPVGAVIVSITPHPSLAVVKHWRGIVEIVLRTVAAVLALVCLIACAAAQDDVSSDDVDEKLLERSNAAAGWGIFICFVALLTEAVIILLRFLNCGFIQNFPKLSLVVDIAVSGWFALLLLITGIPLAVYANQWDDEVEAADDSLEDTLRRIPPALRAAAGFSFIAMTAFIVLLVWMLVHLFLGWCTSSASTHNTDSDS